MDDKYYQVEIIGGTGKHAILLVWASDELQARLSAVQYACEMWGVIVVSIKDIFEVELIEARASKADDMAN